MLAYMCIKTAIMVLKDKDEEYDVAVGVASIMIIGLPVMLCIDILFSPFEILGLIAYLLRRENKNEKNKKKNKRN